MTMFKNGNLMPSVRGFFAASLVVAVLIWLGHLMYVVLTSPVISKTLDFNSSSGTRLISPPFAVVCQFIKGFDLLLLLLLLTCFGVVLIRSQALQSLLVKITHTHTHTHTHKHKHHKNKNKRPYRTYPTLGIVDVAVTEFLTRRSRGLKGVQIEKYSWTFWYRIIC